MIQRLESIIKSCDSKLLDTLASNVLEEADLATCLRDVGDSKRRLDKAQQMEKHTASLGDGADARDSTPNEQLKNLAASATAYRESVQKAYEGKKASAEAIQMDIKAREEIRHDR